MFLPLEFQSVNDQRQLQAGEYHASCRTYASADGACTMLQFEYVRIDDELTAACEIVFAGPDGVLSACDFLRMPDLSWRDCFGARADSLLDLLPRAVGSFQLVSLSDLGVQRVGNAT
ncbi:conserved protein of unknown function (plasmid) [Paraburkholderia kururiensis]